MDTEKVLEDLKSDVTGLASSMLSNYKDAAANDGRNFIDNIKENLKKWTKQLENGELDKDEMESLIRGQKDLAEMKTLKQLGLAKIQVDKFVDAVIDKTIDKLTSI